MFQLLLNRKGARLGEAGKKRRRVVPPPCCVPTELAPLTMLFIEDFGKSHLNPLKLATDEGSEQTSEESRRKQKKKNTHEVLKVVNYENMSAQSCGCR